MLNDLFGIQARSGCFCAGPYVHRMYPIDDAWSERMDAEVAQGHLGAKLAFARLSFNYFISEAVFDYIVDAVHLVADEGWKLLPLYRFDPDSGIWQPPRRDARRRRRSDLAVAFDGAPPRVRHRARERAGRPPRGGAARHRAPSRPRRRRPARRSAR